MSRIEELEKQMAELQAEIERERKREKETCWPPVFEAGEHYYSVTTSGGTCESVNENDEVDRGRIAFGTAFKNKEQADWSAERDQLLRPALGPVMPSDEVLLSGWFISNSGTCLRSRGFGVDCARLKYITGFWRQTQEEVERVREGLLALIEKSAGLSQL